MATAPQFIAAPMPVARMTPATLTAANIGLDGTGATGRALICQASAIASGSKLPAVAIEHVGTNTNPTVIRFFRNNGSDPEVASNNALIAEVAVAANTLSQSAASIPYVAALNLNLAAGERIYATNGTAGSTAGFKITPINAGDYN